MASSSLYSPNSISPMESTGGGFFGILTYKSMSALLHLGEYATSGSLGVECFQLSLDISGELCISSSCICSPVLSEFLSEHVTGQFRLLILVSSCWMEATWLPTVLNMWKTLTHQCSFIKVSLGMF